MAVKYLPEIKIFYGSLLQGCGVVGSRKLGKKVFSHTMTFLRKRTKVTCNMLFWGRTIPQCPSVASQVGLIQSETCASKDENLACYHPSINVKFLCKVLYR